MLLVELFANNNRPIKQNKQCPRVHPLELLSTCVTTLLFLEAVVSGWCWVCHWAPRLVRRCGGFVPASLQLLIVVGSTMGKGSACLSARHLHHPPETLPDIKKLRKTSVAHMIIYVLKGISWTMSSPGNKNPIISSCTIFFPNFHSSANSSFVVIPVSNKIP